MNQGPIWGRFMKKTRGQKSRATVPLRENNVYLKETEAGAFRPLVFIMSRPIWTLETYPEYLRIRFQIR